MALKRTDTINFTPRTDIASWLDEWSTKSGEGTDLIMNTALREYIKTHSPEEVEAQIREAAQIRQEWPGKGGFTPPEGS